MPIHVGRTPENPAEAKDASLILALGFNNRLRMKRILFTILIAIPFLSNAAQVYKRLDENGNITFTDKPSDNAEKIEVKINNIHPSSDNTGEQIENNKLLVTVTSKAKISSIVRDVGTISFNNNKKYILTGFLYSLKRYLEEYESITLTFRAEDIPYAEVDDYNSVTLSELLSDIDKKNMIKVKQSANSIVIQRDW